MTDEWGIQHRYDDAAGVERAVEPSTIGVLRELLGRPEAAEPGPLVVRIGVPARVGPARLRLEDGGEVEIADTLPPDVPIGYHWLRTGDGERRLIVHPGRCPLPPHPRMWGFAVQLYASRSQSSWGMGDLRDLRRLARWSRDELGAGFALVNPLAATTDIGSGGASPYFPATRRFLNPIYIPVEEVPGADLPGDELASLATLGRALNDDRTIDRDAVWGLKRAALESIWPRAREDAEFVSWCRAQPASLFDFATWCTIAERLGPQWRDWPQAYRHPRGAAVAGFRRDHDDRVRFHAWLQWLTVRSLAAASDELPIVHDLPIGIDPNGMDAWQWQDLLAMDAAVGAPPDEFNRRGQHWGFPPFVPWRLRAAGYAPLAETIAAALRFGGGLRVDHVMGLFRLWWIPAGADATRGAYVRYPAEELLAIVAIESHRAGAFVVGEDLGTVEAAARETLARWNVLSTRLLWFETSDPATWPSCALAAVTTHDLPTVRGLLDGSDLEDQRRHGVEANEESTRAIRDRLRHAGALDEHAAAEESIVAAYRLVARAPSRLVAVTLEDAAAEAERPNVPGATGRPNWSRALPAPLEELETRSLPRRLAAVVGGSS